MNLNQKFPLPSHQFLGVLFPITGEFTERGESAALLLYADAVEEWAIADRIGVRVTGRAGLADKIALDG